MLKDTSKNFKIIWFTVIGLLLVFFIASIIQLVFLGSMKNKQRQLNHSLDNIQQQLAGYKKKIEYLQSDEFWEEYAREHGYVKQGDEPIEVGD